jgi:hypothetical protein
LAIFFPIKLISTCMAIRPTGAEKKLTVAVVHDKPKRHFQPRIEGRGQRSGEGRSGKEFGLACFIWDDDEPVGWLQVGTLSPYATTTLDPYYFLLLHPSLFGPALSSSPRDLASTMRREVIGGIPTAYQLPPSQAIFTTCNVRRDA